MEYNISKGELFLNTKIYIILSLIVASMSFSGCMNTESNQESSVLDTSVTTTSVIATTTTATTTEITTEETTKKETSEIEVTHTITIPYSWIENFEDTIQYFENDEDIISCTVNDDNSITLEYNDKKHQNILEEQSKAVYKYIDIVLEQSKDLTAITDMIINDDNMTDVSVYVDGSKYNSQVDGIIISGLYYQTQIYKLFREDLSYDEFSLTAHIIDNSTDEEITSITYS